MKFYCPLLIKIINHFLSLVIIPILFTSTLAWATPHNSYAFESPQDEDIFTELTREIRCVVCQNQSLAESSAPLAKDLRGKIYQMILIKKSKTEIKNYLAKRYGEFILLRPLVNKTNFLLWIFPVLGVMFFLFMLVASQFKVVVRS